MSKHFNCKVVIAAKSEALLDNVSGIIRKSYNPDENAMGNTQIAKSAYHPQ
jgi:hypothetical protein